MSQDTPLIGEEADAGVDGRTKVAQAMDAVGMGWAQFEVMLLAGGVFVTEGCLLVIASIVVRTLEVRWGNTMFETTLLATSMFVGVSVGCLTGGLQADTGGRRPAILVCYFGTSVMLCLSAVGTHMVWLVISNVLLGFFFGYGVPAANSLIAESCPASMRSNLVCSSAIMFAMGQLVAGCIVWGVSPYLEYDELDWRVMTLAGSAPILFFAPLAYFRLVESPLWLWSSGNRAGSAMAIQQLARRNNVELPEDALVTGGYQRTGSHASILSEECEMDGKATWLERISVLFEPQIKSMTYLLLFATFASNFCYYGMIYVLPETFAELMLLIEEDPSKVPETTHLSPALSLMLSALFEVPGVLLAILLSHSAQRKTSLTISFSVLSICAIALVSAAAHKKHAVVLTSLAAFAGKLFIASAFILVYLYILEAFPTKVRSSALAFCMTFGRLGAFCVPFTAEICMHVTDTSYSFFAILGVLGFMAALCCLMLPNENVSASGEEEDFLLRKDGSAGSLGNSRNRTPQHRTPVNTPPIRSKIPRAPSRA